MKKVFTPSFFTIVGLIAVATVARFFTPIPNFTPIAAIALFGAAYFSRKSIAFLIPIVALSVSNIWFGFFDTLTMIAVYSAFILAGVIGLWIGKQVSVTRVIGGALLSSIVFFVLTNFASWIWLAGLGVYPMSFAGLMMSYVAGLPFFRNEVLGTLVYSGVLFGAYEFAKSRIPALAR